MTETSVSPPKKVRVIEPTVKPKATANSYRQLRVAAYCRVSTQMEEQLNSYEVQKSYYTEKINSEPKWKLVGIFADKGITGTSALKRDEFQKSLTAKGIKTPSGKSGWNGSTVRTILSNEKYKGDALLNKTYISDCISKKVKKNNGERPMYYVENNHPAIIDKDTFNRVQEELARRTSKRKVKQVGTKTEQGKYSSKYALTELLICGECGTPYRRCTRTASGEKKIVWRCINRLDYGKKYCHHSPTIEESVLQNAIVTAIMNNAQQSADVLSILKEHIRIGIQADEVEDNSFELLIEIAKLDEKYNELFNKMTADTEDIESIENQLIEIINKKHLLQARIEEIKNERIKRENVQSRLEQIYLILDGLKNHPMTYNDTLVRQILDTVVVESKDKIKVVFTGGYEAEQELG